MADEQASKKPKRRLRPAAAPETMRERADKATQELEAKQKSDRQLSLPKADKPKRKLPTPVRIVWRPIAWVGRHIIPGYFKSAFRELRQTTWPSRKQSRQLTMAVVIFAVVFGAFVSILDYGLDKLFKEVFAK